MTITRQNDPTVTQRHQ